MVNVLSLFCWIWNSACFLVRVSNSYQYILNFGGNSNVTDISGETYMEGGSSKKFIVWFLPTISVLMVITFVTALYFYHKYKQLERQRKHFRQQSKENMHTTVFLFSPNNWTCLVSPAVTVWTPSVTKITPSGCMLMWVLSHRPEGGNQMCTLLHCPESSYIVNFNSANLFIFKLKNLK